GGQVRHPDAAVSALADLEDAVAGLLPALERQGLAPANVTGLAAETGIDAQVARKALTQLVSQGAVVRLGPEMHFAAPVIGQARERLVAHLTAHGSGTASELREALGVSRKFAIPLLEYFDAQGVTRREGDARTLRKA
ncbi:MAG: SelB C-terminal domain-containing protein, partial [Coriobacteriia bacterium]|nr:SelB C-terminal domain-containing protein [Coriobacteriia bacterium]